MPVAVVVGASPAVCFGAAAKTAYGVDELAVAGGLLGEAIEVVRGRTVDLLVPADAEYVIEGHVDPDHRTEEGPFGEGLGFMTAAGPAPAIDVSAICHRSDPIFHGYVQQLPPTEGHVVWAMGLLGPLWYYLVGSRAGLRGLADLEIVPGAAGLSALVVQVEPGHGKEARRILDRFAGINFGQKAVIVVDRDIDIRDLETLQWALSTRVDPEQDIRIRANVSTYLLDPTTLARNDVPADAPTPAPYASSMQLIDATLKCRIPEISIPGKQRMLRVLKRWNELGLPEVRPRERLLRLLDHHSETDLLFSIEEDGSEEGPTKRRVQDTDR